ncbi:MAG: hypothetical protein ACRD0J_17500, partial [Acidimicrobiales bacterium]
PDVGPARASSYAQAFASAMRYGFGAGDIVARSYDILSAAFTVVLSCQLPEGLGVLPAAAVLCGHTDGPIDQAGLWSALSRQRRVGPEMDRALDDWERFMALSARERQRDFAAPMNKLTSLLRAAPYLWRPDPAAQWVPIRDVLSFGGAAVVNFGGLPGDASEWLPSIFTHLLWSAVRETCGDWGEGGRAVKFFTDELDYISGRGSDGDVIEDMASKGRSYGLQMGLATQRFGQLPARTASAVRGMSTKGYLRAENAALAQEAVDDLTGGALDSFTEGDLRSLPRYVAALRTRANGEPQPAFTLHVADDRALDVAHMRPDLMAGAR